MVNLFSLMKMEQLIKNSTYVENLMDYKFIMMLMDQKLSHFIIMAC